MIKTTKQFEQERLTQGQRVGMINLGCARNLTDAQTILGRLKKNGHRVVDLKNADVAIVNTCAFIEEARQESIDTILELLELKKKGKIQKVIVAGCLAQRYGTELAQEFKEVDAFVGTPTLSRDAIPQQLQLTPPHFAYVKICESCYNQCSFCAIPKIKGKFISRSIESVVREVQLLDAQGVKEINLIGQDITAYGMDVYREKALARLLKEITAATKNIQWIRLLYAFPAHVTDKLIETIAREPKICSYLDIPLQHVSDHLLTSMNRGITKAGTIDLIRRLRAQISNVFLRTTFIVGLPGETEQDFQELRAFVRESRFERMGVFLYSREEGTAAYKMPGQVAAATKHRRMKILMADQKSISAEVQAAFVGQHLKVLIEEKQTSEKHLYLGRGEFDAPEVDGTIFVRSTRSLQPGDMVDVKITDAYEYDLSGEAA